MRKAFLVSSGGYLVKAFWVVVSLLSHKEKVNSFEYFMLLPILFSDTTYCVLKHGPARMILRFPETLTF
jgi:hypothetical protein